MKLTGKNETTRCRRCNRKLKDPESIQIGIGKTCLRKILGAARADRKRRARAYEGQMTLFEESACTSH
jgi:hypothetical protein